MLDCDSGATPRDVAPPNLRSAGVGEGAHVITVDALRATRRSRVVTWRQRRVHGARLFIALMLAVTATIAAPASALAQYEPNEGLGQAYGPLVGGTPYSGGIETQNDQDWFYFYTSGQAQIDISIVLTSTCGGVVLQFVDSDNRIIDERYSTGAVEHILYTVPGPAKYYLVVPGYFYTACTVTYQFRIDPASAVTATPPPAPPPPVQPPPATPPPSSPSPSFPSGPSAACQSARSDASHYRQRLASARRKLRTARTRRARARARSQVRLYQRRYNSARQRVYYSC